MPRNTVSVTRPGRYGNVFTLSDALREFDRMDKEGIVYGSRLGWREMVVDMYRKELLGRQMINPQAFENWIAPLRGKHLACFCPLDRICHADVLLELANPK